jgi:ferrous iron transport protein A
MKIMQKKRTIADLNSNEVAYIAENQNGNIPLKLIQMGCVSNTKVVLKMKAPSSDPVCIQIGGNDIALRIAEAKKIDITTR